MAPNKWQKLAAAVVVGATLIGSMVSAQAQAPEAALLAAVHPGAVVRRVVLKDAASAEQFRQKLDSLKASGLFRDQLPGLDPKKPVPIEISFLTSGNYVLMIGSQSWVDANIESVRLMAFLYDRPRAHLQLNLRVVQLTGPANASVIQMSEAVRALVDSQREEVVRTFADLEDYLVTRMTDRQGSEREVLEAARELLPTLGDGGRPLTVPEILLLMMLDRASPAPKKALPRSEESEDLQEAIYELPRVLSRVLQNPNTDDAAAAKEIQDELAAWKKAISSAREWCGHFSAELKKKGGGGVGAFREALQRPDTPVPQWLTRRLMRSLDLTERLYPNLVQRHTQSSLEELERRFAEALQRAETIEQALAKGEMPPDGAVKEGEAPMPAGTDPIGRNLVALKSLAEEMVPAPMALFESVALAADNSAPNPQQLIKMFREYRIERRKLDLRLTSEMPNSEGPVNYAKLQGLESGLNLWLRRVSEAMARSLEQQFYRRYVNEIRLLANKQLGKTSNRDILSQAGIDEVPDVTRDLLLADTGVNIFLTNSISLQFAPETTNTVSAQVQAQLPSKLGLLDRIQQASQAATALNVLTQQYGIQGEGLIKALLGGGQAVPVQAGVTLSASPTIGFDGSTVTLNLTANQTLQPNSDKVADRVTNHSINSATVTALSYEPMVLSTLASNISYYESSGGFPILRKLPIAKDLLKDLPFKPFKQEKRQKGVYQSSVIILEPVVIPTIEDLVRFHGGWRQEESFTDAVMAEPAPEMPAAVPAAPPPAAPAAAPAPAPAPAPAAK